MNIDPTTTKYVITAKISTDGVVEKPDVVGAIFGQTEGLLGEELDLRELQKTGRIGRIEVEITSKKGKSEGRIVLPSSLDQVETAILASALETIERVGPCKAHIEIEDIDDVRATKKQQIVERAKQLLSSLMEKSKVSGINLTESVRQAVQVEEIVTYGADRCPAGPAVEHSDTVIVVEGRSDVINLLKYGIKNAIAVDGTNIPKTVIELSKEKTVTVFADGDRGGELIIRELLQRADIDFIARAPPNTEVEELTMKQIIKALRNKMPVEQYISVYGLAEEETERKEELPEPKPVQGKVLSPELKKYKDALDRLSGKQRAILYDKNNKVIQEIAVRDLAETLKNPKKEVGAVVFDGIISQRLLDISAEKKVATLVGMKLGNVIKVPVSVKIYVSEDLN